MSDARKFLRSATPVAAAIFVVSATTGTLLFFEIAERQLKDLHAWIGLAFVAAVALHITRNGRSLLGYTRGAVLWIALVAALATAAAFIVPALGPREGGGNVGPRKLIEAAQRAPLDELAPLIDTTPAALAERLKAAGLTVPATSASLADIAAASNRPPREVLDLALAGLPAPAPPGR